MSARPPLLIYRDTCPKCRFLSRLAVMLSLGSIERVSLVSARAQGLTQEHPEIEGKLTLLYPTGSVTGWNVVPASVRHTLGRVFTQHGHA